MPALKQKTNFSIRFAVSTLFYGFFIFVFLFSIVLVKPATVSAGCINNKDCDGGQICDYSTDTCRACKDDSECDTGTTCNSGACVSANGGTPSCNTTKCQASQVCFQAACTTRSSLGIPDPTNGGTCSTGSNDLVKQMQSKAGMLTPDQDGICGPNTITAIQVYQKNNGLTPDGLVGDKTLEKMSLSTTPPGTAPPGGNPPPSQNPPNNSGVQCDVSKGQFEIIGGLCVPKSPFKGAGIAGSGSITDIITIVLKALLYLSGLIAVVMIIVGGFWYITSAGNEEQAEKGRKALTNAIIGLVVVVLAFAIVTVITNALTGGIGSSTLF